MAVQASVCRLACIVWLAAGAALAQTAPAPDPPAASSAPTSVGEVVVQGRAPVTPKEFAKAVEAFVHDQGRPGPIGQISRWGEPVCPATAGLSRAFDDFVNRRIEEVAARVGAPTGGGCRRGANLMVMFTTRPDELMADVRNRHEPLLGYHYVGQTPSLAAFEPPMKSWYVTTTVLPGGGGMFDQAYAPGPPQGGRIPPPLKSQFAFVFVVVDANILEGQAIGPVADRIAMLALSRPAPRQGCSALPSILDFLDPRCPSGGAMDGLTPYDEAYLEALYAYRGSEIRAFERASIRQHMVKAIGALAPDAGRR